MQVNIQDINLVLSATRLVSSLLGHDYSSVQWLSEQKPEKLRMRFECMVLFAVVWSLGVNTDNAGRSHFDVHFAKILAGETDDAYKAFQTSEPVKLQQPLPPGSVRQEALAETGGSRRGAQF